MVPGCPGRLLQVVAGLLQEKMGGSSGAVGLGNLPFWLKLIHSLVNTNVVCVSQLYSLFLTAAAGHVTQDRSEAADWARAVHAGTQAISRSGNRDYVIYNPEVGLILGLNQD